MERLKKFCEFLQRIIVVLSFLYSIYAFIRDDVLTEEQATNLRLRGVLGRLSWEISLIIALFLLVIILATELMKKNKLLCSEAKFNIGFQNIDYEDGFYIIRLERSDPDTIEEKIQEKKRFYNSSDYLDTRLITSDYLKLSHRKKVSEYLDEFRAWLELKELFSTLYEFQPSFANEGITVSKGTLFEFIFPDEVKIATDEDLILLDEFETWNEPKPPVLTYGELTQSVIRPFGGEVNNHFSYTLEKLNESFNNKNALNNGENKIVYKIDSMSPKYPFKDEIPFFVWVRNISETMEFQIIVKTYSDDLMKPLINKS